MKNNHLSDKQITYHRSLIKRLHVLKAKCLMTDDEYSCYLFEFGVESSVEMSIDQLNEAISLLEKKVTVKPQTKEEKEADMWRKRVMAAIGGYLKAIKIEADADYIKAMACRSTGYDRFNLIPNQRLQNVYYTFLDKQKDANKIEFVTSDLIETLTTLN